MELDYANYILFELDLFIEGINHVLRYGEYDDTAFDIVDLYDDCRG